MSMLKLTLLVGPPACGKSSFCAPFRQRNGAAVVLSSDEIREIVCGNAEDQKSNKEVFGALNIACELLLRQGRDVIIDAMNLMPRTRANFITLARKYGAEVKAVVFDVPIEEAKRRNNERARVVPLYVIDRAYANLQVPAPPEVDKVEIISCEVSKVN